MFTYRLALDDQLTTITLDDTGHGMWTHEVGGRIHDRRVLDVGAHETGRLESLLHGARFDALPMRGPGAELELVLDGDHRAMSLMEAPVALRPFLEEMRAISNPAPVHMPPTAPAPTYNAFSEPPRQPMTPASPVASAEGDATPVGLLWPILGVPLIVATQILTATVTMLLVLLILGQVPAETTDLAAGFGEAVGAFLVPLGIALVTPQRRVDRAMRAAYLYVAMDFILGAWLGEFTPGTIALLAFAIGGANLGAKWGESLAARRSPAPVVSW